MYLLGLDVGSSSVKATLLETETGQIAASAFSPDTELNIVATKPDWAEQHPDTWWEHVKLAVKKVVKIADVRSNEITAIGISYQMHGLVAVDRNQKPLRPSIIWCDSRAASIGNDAFQKLGKELCLKHFLNSPGNFTASKLKWVKENEPNIYSRIHKMMLPGDYISMKLTGEINTTFTGLSEGILWDYQDNDIAGRLLEYYGIDDELIPQAHASFHEHGRVTQVAAEELGLKIGTPVTYKAGDQPNNAFSLNVLKPGEAAATAGTSGVIYGIADQPVYDEKSRVNTFIHVNHSSDTPSYGVLLCINGTGILYRWIKQQLIQNDTISYEKMNTIALNSPPGSDGLLAFPFGNGAERILENKNPGGRFSGLNYNRHTMGHLLRAAQEGIIFSMNYGLNIMKQMGLKSEIVKAGRANMFLSPLFRKLFVNTTGSVLELYDTDGSQGAARGAGIGAGIYSNSDEAFTGLNIIETIEPEENKVEIYNNLYNNWETKLQSEILTNNQS